MNFGQLRRRDFVALLGPLHSAPLSPRLASRNTRPTKVLGVYDIVGDRTASTAVLAGRELRQPPRRAGRYKNRPQPEIGLARPTKRAAWPPHSGPDHAECRAAAA